MDAQELAEVRHFSPSGPGGELQFFPWCFSLLILNVNNVNSEMRSAILVNLYQYMQDVRRLGVFLLF